MGFRYGVVELAVPGPLFVEEFRKRGFDLQVTWAR